MRIGCETFLNVCSPRLSSTKCCRIRSAVAGPTTMSPPCANAAKRAATFVVEPLAVKVHRWPAPPPSLVAPTNASPVLRSEEHTSELQSRFDLVCRLLLEKKKGDPPALQVEQRLLLHRPHAC